MNKIYITSDLHFNHSKPFLYEPRNFSSFEEMNSAILENWKEIDDNDDVYILGDIMLEDSQKGMELFNQLKGKIHIILGNHDTEARQKLYKENPRVVDIKYADILKYNGWHFYLSHFETNMSNYHEDGKPLKKRIINLCGHVHTPDRWLHFEDMLCYHCELDAHDNKPVLIDDIITDLQAKNQELKSSEREKNELV